VTKPIDIDDAKYLAKAPKRRNQGILVANADKGFAGEVGEFVHVVKAEVAKISEDMTNNVILQQTPRENFKCAMSYQKLTGIGPYCGFQQIGIAAAALAKAATLQTQIKALLPDVPTTALPIGTITVPPAPNGIKDAEGRIWWLADPPDKDGGREVVIDGQNQAGSWSTGLVPFKGEVLHKGRANTYWALRNGGWVRVPAPFDVLN
jgi:hypothetical protein